MAVAPLRTELRQLPVPTVGADDGLLTVEACGLCGTDWDFYTRQRGAHLGPLILGHEIVATVEQGGARFKNNDRVGVPWLGWTDGTCRFCRSDRENLCDAARFTGYTLDGGYAEYTTADERYCFPLPDSYDDLHAAPLLCAGLIGYRTLRLAGDAQRIGLYGFGAAAHLIAQVAVHQGRRVFAFTRPGDAEGQRFARELGALWAGGSDEKPPEELDAALIFAPVGSLIPAALRAVAKGGTVVAGGIHMSDIPSFPYELLWGERVVRSVANLTRRDGEEFLDLAPRIPIRTKVTTFALEDTKHALDELRAGDFTGSAVVQVRPT